MEHLLGKIISTVIAGLLFYLCWVYVIPYLGKKKGNLVKKIETGLEKRGLIKHYRFTYKATKTFLYIVLALMILLPVLFFLMVAFSNR